jgi:hypothetical protein
MASNIDQMKKELESLIAEGVTLLKDLAARANDEKDAGAKFAAGYERWYTLSQKVVQQLIPERAEDFRAQYRYSGPRRKDNNYAEYAISDFLSGTRVTRYGEELFSASHRAFSQFQTQVQILESARRRADSSLFNIREVLQADLFDSELEKARALHRNRLLREAGVVCGVVLESHLQSVASAHKLRITKKSPTIADLNDPLKNADVYDTPTWRLVQRLADIRNLCDHKKHRDPTSDEVGELIDGVEKITKTVY